MNNIRVGRVSSADYENGLLSVTYADRDGNTTRLIPVFSFLDEYKIPKIGDEVLVLHLSNGAAAGFVLGRFWNKANIPPNPGEGIWHKELGSAYGTAAMTFDSGSGILTIHAPQVRIVSDEGEITLDSAHIQANSAQIDTTGGMTAAADVVAGGVSLMSHTHAGVHGQTSGPG